MADAGDADELESKNEVDGKAAGALCVMGTPDHVHAPFPAPVELPTAAGVLVNVNGGDDGQSGILEQKSLDGVLLPFAVRGRPKVDFLFPGAGKGVVADVHLGIVLRRR